MSEQKNVIDAAVAAATAMTQGLKDQALVLVPAGYQLQSLEQFGAVPTRKRGNLTLHTAGSLIQYVNRHKTASTQVYAQLQPPVFVAIIDDHDAQVDGGSPHFGDHRVTYAPPLSPEWITWSQHSGKAFTQEDFALFLEQNVLDVQAPASGALLEIARTLSATTGAKFRSGTNLQNGAIQITYEEEVNGTAGVEGKTQIPEEFLLAIPVMQGGPRFGVTAKFRYKIKQGVLSLSYDLVRPHKVVEAAVAAVVELIEATDRPVAGPDVTDKETGAITRGTTPAAGTGIQVLYGVPRAAQK